MINVEIPVKPLSVNKAFQGRRFKTKDCKDFERDVSLFLPPKKMIAGDVEMVLEFYLKNHRRTDVSNLVKILEDILVKRGYIEDDRKIYHLDLYKYEAEEDSINIYINKYEQ